jgi:hypothetical protein
LIDRARFLSVSARCSICPLKRFLKGDLPASIFHMKLILDDIASRARVLRSSPSSTATPGTSRERWRLHRARNIETGNPYRKLVADVVSRGVAIELCGATAKAYGWGNENLLPNIKVNTDAMARTVQLVPQGFIKITEAIW